jgi:hypothetical protein
MMIRNNIPLAIINDAYNQLSNAYYFKRNRKAIEDKVTISALMENLAIDFLVKISAYETIK